MVLGDDDGDDEVTDKVGVKASAYANGSFAASEKAGSILPNPLTPSASSKDASASLPRSTPPSDAPTPQVPQGKTRAVVANRFALMWHALMFANEYSEPAKIPKKWEDLY